MGETALYTLVPVTPFLRPFDLLCNRFGRRFVIIGASGLRKSSLLKAGILPQLARRNTKWNFAYHTVATNIKEIDQLKARIAEQASEIEDLRAACAKPVKARHAALPPPAESTPPQAVSGDEAKARMARVNNDRSAYQQQGLRPAGGARGR